MNYTGPLQKNKKNAFLLCVICIYIKYTWVVPLKDKKGITLPDALQKFLNESCCKPNKT